MRLANIDLCYSLNVFPAENDISSRLDNIGSKFVKIRKSLGLSDTTPFALGFWFDAIFAEQIDNSNNFDIIRKFLEHNNFYVFTVNAFPYGKFHGTAVKEKVYTPDWTTAKRRDFTCKAAAFLARLLPENTTGSISTLPGGYKKSFSPASIKNVEQSIAENLLFVATYLENVFQTTGQEIVLGIEMEPDCLWENPSEFIEFYHKYLGENQVAQKFIGVCYDTAHQELTMNPPGKGLDLLLENKIRIAKIQLSTALKTTNSSSADFDALQPFADQVYLHQTRLVSDKGSILEKFSDIPDQKSACISEDNSHLVSHFHLPLFCSLLPGSIAAANQELIAVLNKLKKSPSICKNIEIETYTYSVLPEIIDHNKDITECIAQEYKWVIKKWHSI